MYNNHFSKQDTFKILAQLFQPLCSFPLQVLFQSFFPQNISLLPKIVTEALANLKKRKLPATVSPFAFQFDPPQH